MLWVVRVLLMDSPLIIQLLLCYILGRLLVEIVASVNKFKLDNLPEEEYNRIADLGLQCLAALALLHGTIYVRHLMLDFLAGLESTVHHFLNPDPLTMELAAEFNSWLGDAALLSA